MRSRPLWRFMWSGLGIGLLVVAAGALVHTELSALAIGYGVMMVLAALYLAAGLLVRERVRRHRTRLRGPGRPSSTRLQGHRVF